MAAYSVKGQSVEGIVTEKGTGEPLPGVQIVVTGTTIGTTTEADGKYVIVKLPHGNIELQAHYLSFKTAVVKMNAKRGEKLIINIEMEPDDLLLDEVVISGRKNMESEKLLLTERKLATAAIETIGAGEMSVKGISNAAEGVKKLSGISFDGSRLFVRGLGDRYSITTLNGLPIASPNPDNKLIPLDIFPSSSIRNITVSKVYDAETAADYSGAHIDISTKESGDKNSFSVGVGIGGRGNTIFKDFYQSQSKGGMLRSGKIKDYPFENGFSVDKKSAIPNLSLNMALGRVHKIGNGKLDWFISGGSGLEKSSMQDAYIANLNVQGTTLNEFRYDSYTTTLKLSGLFTAGYEFEGGDRINYTAFYSRNAIDDYKRREGFDSEGNNLVGSNSVFHAYSLFNNQLSGSNRLTKRTNIEWAFSYGTTNSNEPDRRQVMFRNDNGKLSLFKLNRQETMRYFGALNEKEYSGNIKLIYKYGSRNSLTGGFNGKYKDRDYNSVRYYYNLTNINPDITDIYNTDDYLNDKNIESGAISIIKDNQPKYGYEAYNRTVAAFAETDIYCGEKLLFNLGIRGENALQYVDYYNDASMAKRSRLNSWDIFPAINVKYSVNKEQTLRLSLSKTVTRPSFIESSPFLYKESYGSAEMRGNEDLKNGYNYNVDLRYEYISGDGALYSVTAYYKYLQSPIERIQESSGGAVVHSFRNADNGMALGAEVEIKRPLLPNLNISANGSFIYTNVDLPSGGVYTDAQRSLQGASPYLVNADIVYSPMVGEKRLSLSLVYNLQGPRIQSVGIYGMSNVIQQPLNTLNFTGSLELGSGFTITAKANNLTNSDVKFTQKIKESGRKVVTEQFRQGVGFEIGMSFKL